MSDTLPTSDEFFGGSGQGGGQLPTADEFFSGGQPSDIIAKRREDQSIRVNPLADNFIPQANAAVDAALTKTSPGRILNAFGQGAKNAWGSEPVALPDPVQQVLKKSGFWDEYANTRNAHLKALNEVLFRPAAATLDRFLGPALTDITAGIRGVSALAGGVEAAAVQTGKETGFETAGQTAAEFTEAGMSGAFLPMHVAVPPDLPKARSLGVIGEGEGGYMGTKAPEPISDAARAEAVKQTIQDQAEAPGPTGLPAEATEQPGVAPAADVTAPAPAPDIHAVAREIAPDAFHEYDNLSQRRDAHRRWIDELRQTRQEQAEAAAPHADEIAELHAKMEDATPRLRKKYQARLDELEPERDAFIEEKTSTDTPDMARVREVLQKADYRMRDLAPDVAKAYREAQERQDVAPETPEPAQAAAEPAAQPEAAAQPEIAPTAGKAIPAEAVQKPSEPNVTGEKLGNQTTQAHLDAIAADVSKKLQGAGRPKEEADAAGQLVASHYEVRAARFKGEKGNAYELFAREAPTIREAKVQKAKEFAQGKTLEQGKKGSITLGNARNTIKLFKDADASTFIHETGHDWLEELFRDAGTDGVVDQVKTDAQTVRDWLGVKEGENIPTKAHEKFARGFERYMMEGVAPSAKLANVFAKFKDWLTKIYQTVQKLRSPINDDIRAVFDRMLSTNPEKTVIAPERAEPEHMADFHEREAETTPPEHAEKAADQVRADVDESVKQTAPEVHDELPHKQVGGIPRADAVPDRGGNAPESVRGAEVDAAERSEVAEGGNETAPEGGAAQRGPTGEPGDANQRFTDGESTLVDKAGNIRLDNLNTPEDVNEVIRETSNTNDAFIGARRGVLTDGEVIDLADALGMKEADLDARKIGQAFNAEQIIAARKLLIKSATNLKDLMGKAATGGDAELLAYAEAKERHIMIQSQVSGITAEAGRALRAFRKLEGGAEAEAMGSFLDANDAKTLFQLKEEAKLGSKLQTPQQVSKFVNDTKQSAYQKGRSMVLEYYINALISGPITHLRYSVGNALNALWTPLVEIPAGAAIGKATEMFGGESGRVYLGESGAQLYALVKGSQDGWRAAYEAFRANQSPALPGEKASNLLGPSNAIPGIVGKVINVPSRSVSAIHSFFKAIRYEQNIQGLAYRTAMQEGREGADFQNRIAELTTTPTPDMLDEAGELDPAKMSPELYANVQAATRDALKELYMAPTDYTSAIGQLNRAINNNIVAKIIVPFMKIGSQITRNAFIERTPLGIFDKEVRANILGENGGAARDMQLGKIAAGVSLAGITVGLAAEGMATGDGPEDPAARAVWLLNHRPNTITIGEISIPYQGLGGLGMLMRFSANMHAAASQIGHDDMGKVAVAFLEGATKSILDENFMRGVKDMLDAVYHPQEYGPSYVKGFVTNWLPFSVGMSQVARQVDPFARDTSSPHIGLAILKAAQAKVPYLSEGLAPRRDVFGQPIPNGENLNSDYHDDPTIKALDDLGLYPGRLSKKIRGVELNDAQFDDYARVSGRIMKMQLDNIVKQPGFGSLPDYERFSLMQHTIESSREVGRSLVLMQNPSLIQAAIDAKIAKVKGLPTH